MKTSREQLLAQSGSTNFKAEMLEKVWKLMEILNGISAHPYLKDRLVLKGGTALNLFLTDLPRLSVDIDLNYIGQVKRELMQEERPMIEKALESMCAINGMQMRRAPKVNNPGAHAGGKFHFRYESALGNQGNLEVDISYMYRIPIWTPIKLKSVAVGQMQTEEVPVLTAEEIAAGKLSALFTRQASRDLFDVHHLMHNVHMDKRKLKVSFLIYGVMGPNDLRNMSLNQVKFDKNEYYQNLVPVLRKDEVKTYKFFDEWSNKLERECQDSLRELLTFKSNEKEFLDQFYEKKMLNLSLITDDKTLQDKMDQHPLLAWRKQHADFKKSLTSVTASGSTIKSSSL